MMNSFYDQFCPICKYCSLSGEEEPCCDCLAAKSPSDVRFVREGDNKPRSEMLEDFARFVASEVIDEEMWQLNHEAFAELACRKLYELGIVGKMDDNWILKED